MTDAEPMIETTTWLRVVPKHNTRGQCTGIDVSGATKNRPTGKGAYMKLTLRFPRRLFEFPDTNIQIDVEDSMLEGTPAEIVADLADLRRELGP